MVHKNMYKQGETKVKQYDRVSGSLTYDCTRRDQGSTYPASMSECLKGARTAKRDAKSHVKYQCLKSKQNLKKYRWIFIY